MQIGLVKKSKYIHGLMNVDENIKNTFFIGRMTQCMLVKALFTLWSLSKSELFFTKLKSGDEYTEALLKLKIN